jgi:Ca2+-binding EF-hand superfamily protein
MYTLFLTPLLFFASTVFSEEDWTKEAAREARRDSSRRDNFEREFNEYDKDGNGVLDAADIRSKFGSILDAEMLFQFFADSDLDENGVITIDEYAKYVELVEKRTKQDDV